MKIVAIIAEYNPFHKGHQYQLEQAKAASGATHAVAIMSGNFVQRGQAALCSKWARAEMAVRGGLDLVVELPVVFACQSAQYFAMGGVALAKALGVDFLSFGVETENLEALRRAAELLTHEPSAFRDELADYMRVGMSFPAARAKAASAFGCGNVLQTPNDILAVEYLKAAGNALTPVPVRRKGSIHDGPNSASHIRALLEQGADASALVPQSTLMVLKHQRELGLFPLRTELLDTAILALLRSIPPQQLAQLRDVTEGLEFRIKECAQASATVPQLIDRAKTKRYTHARLRRIAVNALLGITKDTASWQPQYVRVLAMNEHGRDVLKRAKENCTLPIITKTANAPQSPMLGYDLLASDLYALAYPAVKQRTGGRDFTTSPIVL